MSVKNFIKAILSIFYNGTHIIRFKNIKYPFYIGKGLITHNPNKIFLGKGVRIGRFGRLSCYGNELYPNIKIMDNVYIGDNFSALAGGQLIIDENTLIASYVAVLSENHSIDPECGIGYGKQPLIEKETIIGKECWIGEKAVILPGVHIGDWCIIGGMSVVTTDIPPYSIAVGNPAKVIKKYNFNTKKWEKPFNNN